jgi:catalase
VAAAAAPQSFWARLDADRPDPATGKPDPARQKAAAEQTTDNRALGAWFAKHRPPASDAQAPYHSLHAFRFIDAKGTARWVKWRFVPLDGEPELSEDELKAAPTSFLEGALASRLQRGPVEWDLPLALGESGDPIDSPTLAWPATRREVSVGRPVIRQSGGTACEVINFDTLVLSDGIEPSPDAVLQFRSAAYGGSFARRL